VDTHTNRYTAYLYLNYYFSDAVTHGGAYDEGRVCSVDVNG